MEVSLGGSAVHQAGFADDGIRADAVSSCERGDATAPYADGAHDEPEPAFLSGKDVLDARADGIAAGDVRRHLPASGLFVKVA